MSAGKILVVDDNAFNLELLVQELEDEDYEVVPAESGEECLAELDKGGFHAVVLDWMMPGMSGMEVLQAIREKWSRTELPVIMATAKAQSADMVEALNAGANDYVTKPIDTPVLLARLSVLVDVQAPQRPRTSKVLAPTAIQVQTRHHFCPECHYAVCADADTCEECGAQRPDAGWDETSESNYVFLGGQWDRYFFDRALGRGGGGSVYRVLNVDLQRHFVAKVLDLRGTEHISGTDMREFARGEVQALASLNNPHIVQIFELIDLDDDHVAVIMEHVKGLDLEHALRELGPMPPNRALDVIRQVASGLHEVHSQGLVHCDIKPGNIMLQLMPDDRYFAKLIDFGITRTQGDAGEDGVFTGTLRYCSPEQLFQPSPIDARADIYSLGLVLFYVLSGKRPYTGSKKSKMLAAKLTSSAPKLAAEFGLSHSSERLDKLIEKMTFPQPDGRYESILDVLHAVDALVSDSRLRKNPFVETELSEESEARWNDPTVVTGVVPRREVEENDD